MSGPSAVMDYHPPPRLKLLNAFLLVSIIICLQGNPTKGVDHDLRCVTDYLYAVDCSLNVAPAGNRSDSNTSYWLTFLETEEEYTFVCALTNTNGEDFCSANKSDPIPEVAYYYETFTDTDRFEISLCHNLDNGSEVCKQLDEEYAPVENVKPNAPCCLTVAHNASEHHFTWTSTYEEFDPFTGLVESLTFQLRFYKKEDKHNVSSHAINTNRMKYSVDDQNFVPDTEYAGRVRTSPDQTFYKGQWSEWSSEAHWKTESAVNEKDPTSNKLFFGLLFLVVPVIFFFCYTSLKKWRQSAFIPTPAPYFDNLYSDCQGDFKSWVVTHENMADMLKAEETLHIDMLTKCAVVEEEVCKPQFPHLFMEGSGYSNITETSPLGFPYAVSTMAPRSSPESSLQCLTLASETGSPDEGDSGCWLERDPPWYCNEYCTLSAFQQSRPVSAEDHGSPSTKSYSTGE